MIQNKNIFLESNIKCTLNLLYYTVHVVEDLHHHWTQKTSYSF